MSYQTDPSKIVVGDQSDLLRGEKGFTPESNFWNEPFPEDMLTVNGNIARFEKTWNKTHTTLKSRRCAIKIEVEKSDGSTQIIEVGTFLIGTTAQNDSGMTLQIEDLTKKLIETPASTVKAGYQWYRNIPVKILVEELIKKAYPDPRNGEVPREYLIDGIRPKSPSSDPLITSLGKPPGFSRLYEDVTGEGICYSIAKHNFGNGELIYLGIENELYEYDEINQVYYRIGSVLNGNASYNKEFNIKKLWNNTADPDYLYGMAWPVEDLVSSELGETPFNWESKFACPVGSEFILFKASREEIVILFDSTINNLTSSNTLHPKLFTGEFHIVPPYFKTVWTERDYYTNNHPGLENPFNQYTSQTWYWRSWLGMDNTHYDFYQCHVGYGNLDSTTPRPRNTITTLSNLGSPIYWGRQRNLPIPFAQNIGFSCNFFQNFVAPGWVDGLNRDQGEKCFGLSVGISTLQAPWFTYEGFPWYQHNRNRLFIKAMDSMTSNYTKYRDTDTRTNFIVSSQANGNFTPYELDEVFDGKLPSIPYNLKAPAYEHLPYAQTSMINFDPGYLAYYGEFFYSRIDKNNYGFDLLPMPYLKYTSGQKGSVEFIQSYGAQGGIFYQAYTKQGFTTSNRVNPRFRLIDAKDIVTNLPSGNPGDRTYTDLLDMRLTCYMYDIATDSHIELTNLNYSNFVRTTSSSKTYPKQITAVTATGTTLCVISNSYPNKNSYPTDTDNECNIYCHVDQVVLNGGASVTVTNRGNFTDKFFTDAIWIENSIGTKRVLLSGYDPTRILDTIPTSGRPSLGRPYSLWTHEFTGSTVIQMVPFYADQKRHLVSSPTTQSFYSVGVENRTEQLGGVKLTKIGFDDDFNYVIPVTTELYTASDALSVSDTNSIGAWENLGGGNSTLASVLLFSNPGGYAISCTATNSSYCYMRYPLYTYFSAALTANDMVQISLRAACTVSGYQGGKLMIMLSYLTPLGENLLVQLGICNLNSQQVVQSIVVSIPANYSHNTANRLVLTFKRADGLISIGESFTIERLSFSKAIVNLIDNEVDLGYINDAVYGDANELSNLLPITFTDGTMESVLGVSDGYYANPINKVTRKNHLWKYDNYLSGVIELAELSDMSVWDAITDLAYSLNFITGFSNDIFFFIPKSVNATPDLILDLDLDGVLKVEKVQDNKVENIIRAVPHRVRKGEIEWTIITIANETTANDTDRVQLNTDLRVDQKDDLEKKVFLRVSSIGYITTSTDVILDQPGESDADSTLRFAYLVANSVIETKLIRDALSSDTQVVLPSLFGQDTENQVNAGDIFVIDYTDEITGESQFISRIITSIDYNSNEVTLSEPIGQGFLAFTPVTIYRGFYIKKDDLRNNKWSDTGVTLTHPDGFIETVTGTTDMWKIKVLSIQHLGLKTLVQFGNLAGEYEIDSLVEATTTDPYYYIIVKSFRGSSPLIIGTTPILNSGTLIKAYWFPRSSELIEVGGSKVWLGFAPGSYGTFWMNSRGQERIEIICPGLILEADNQAVVTAVDVDSIKKFGKFTKTIDTNRFFQIQLAQYQAREYLKWNSKPRLIFNIDDIIQAKDKGGNSYTIPYFKFINTSTRKLSNIRVVSRKYLARFPGFAADCYIIDHSLNIKSFIQSLSLRTKDTY